MKKILTISAFTLLVIQIGLFAQLKNIDKPLKGKWDYQMEEVWEVGEAGDDIFAAVNEIVLSDEGDIFIQDYKNFKIYKFSKDGKFAAAFGKKGEGPGETKGMDALYSVDRYIIIPDSGRIHFFYKDGRFGKAVPVSAALEPRAFISANEFLSAPLTAHSNPKKPINISIYNLTQKSPKNIAQYQPFVKATGQERHGNTVVRTSIVIHSITPIMVVGYRNGKIIYGMSTDYMLKCVDVKGKEKFSFRVEGREQKTISKSFFKNLANQLKHLPAKTVKNIMDGLPKKASYFERIEMDKNGFIYAFLSDPDNKTGKDIDIFSPKGKFLYTSSIKAKAGRTMGRIAFKDNTLVFEMEDKEGEVYIAKYRIKLPPAQK